MKQRGEEILVQAMKQRVTKDWADAESKKQALASWLKEAREKGEVSYK